MSLEKEVVHVHVKALAVARTEVLLCLLQQEGCLSHSTASLDAYQALFPVHLPHQEPAHRCVSVLHQKLMSAKEGFKHTQKGLFIMCKGTRFWANCKLQMAKSDFFTHSF